MTDSVVILTVALDKPYHEDDVEHITNAIRMIKGVAAVEIGVADQSYWARTTVRQELTEKLFKVLREESGE